MLLLFWMAQNYLSVFIYPPSLSRNNIISIKPISWLNTKKNDSHLTQLFIIYCFEVWDQSSWLIIVFGARQKKVYGINQFASWSDAILAIYLSKHHYSFPPTEIIRDEIFILISSSTFTALKTRIRFGLMYLESNIIRLFAVCISDE